MVMTRRNLQAALGLLLLVMVSGCKEMAWDGPFTRVKDPSITDEFADSLPTTKPTREEIVETLGEPIFSFDTVGDGEVLLYREVLQREGGTAIFFGLIPTGRDFRSYERVLMLFIQNSRVVNHKLVDRIYSLAGQDIEFALDNTAY